MKSEKSTPSLQELLQIKIPILQAPMAGADSAALAMAVSSAGGLGALACALLSPEQIRQQYQEIFARVGRQVNLNFFCHPTPFENIEQERKWLSLLQPYYDELQIDPKKIQPSPQRQAFNAELCDLVLELNPRVVSFHFGFPEISLVRRLQKQGIVILASATSVPEALYLETQGCDVIVAQGSEAGGHRGSFQNLSSQNQVGSLALIPAICDTVKIPVIAAGGIADGRGMAAALLLGAQAVQIGTAYLFCPESNISSLYRETLAQTQGHQTVITNIFSGRPARGIQNRLISEIGAIYESAPEFPLASRAIQPLRSQSEKNSSIDFMQMWSGQGVQLGQALPAAELTRKIDTDARARLKIFSANF